MGEPYYQDDLVTLHHGDALEVSRTLATGSVDCIVTSPPYFGLRDYDHDGQMGSEGSLEEYVAGMVALFAELRRVLADDGTLWLNLGDSYSAAKQLLGVPWRVAFGLQADGWILRSDIIWAKPNPMPDGAQDRPTKSHEYIFMFAKSPRYFFNAASIAEPFADERMGRSGAKLSKFSAAKAMRADGGITSAPKKDARNKRTVWTVASAAFAAAHFAVYPPELIRPCVLAGSRGPGRTVLDPFSGSGTTGMVATQEGRRYIGIDLNAEYLALSLRERFAQPPLNLEGIA